MRKIEKRRELAFFLKNVPGELGRLAVLLKDAYINIEAMAIQDASAYIKAQFNARGKALKRIASSASYDAMMKDSDEYAFVLMLVDQVDDAIKLMAANDYLFEVREVVTMQLANTPGKLAEVTSKLGKKDINILSIYGSVGGPDENCLFIIHPKDMAQVTVLLDELS